MRTKSSIEDLFASSAIIVVGAVSQSVAWPDFTGTKRFIVYKVGSVRDWQGRVRRVKSCISGFGESCDVSLTRLWLGGKSLVSSATQRVAAASENVRDTLYSIRFPRPAMAISVSHSSQGKFQRFLNTRRMTFLQDSGSTCSLAGANKPPIVALLHHVHNVSLVQLHLVDQDRKKTNEKATSSSFCGL